MSIKARKGSYAVSKSQEEYSGKGTAVAITNQNTFVHGVGNWLKTYLWQSNAKRIRRAQPCCLIWKLA